MREETHENPTILPDFGHIPDVDVKIAPLFLFARA